MVFRLSSDYRKMLENAFDKHPPWYDLIISSPMKNNPLHKFFQKRLSSYLPLKDPPMKRSIKKKVHPYFKGRHYALSPMQNHLGVRAPLFERKWIKTY